MIDVDVHELRKRLRLSQRQFSERFNIHISTLRQWEQGRRAPDGPSRILLAVIWHAPEVVDDAINLLSH